jgi:hypothetical protein
LDWAEATMVAAIITAKITGVFLNIKRLEIKVAKLEILYNFPYQTLALPVA